MTRQKPWIRLLVDGELIRFDDLRDLYPLVGDRIALPLVPRHLHVLARTWDTDGTLALTCEWVEPIISQVIG